MRGPKNVKRQHTVPRTYLKNFTYDGDKKLLFAYDKMVGRTQSLSVRNVTVGSRFYDLDKSSVKPEYLTSSSADLNAIDKMMTAIDNKFGPTLQKFLKMPLGSIMSDELKQEMAFFIAIQFLRTFEMRETIVSSQIALHQQLANDITRINFPPEHHHLTPKTVFDPNFEASAHAMFLANPELISDIAQRLCSHLWQLGITNTKVPIYTSDNPVVRYTQIPRVMPRPKPVRLASGEIRSELGITSRYPGLYEAGIVIAFPLSFDRVLILRDRPYFSLQGLVENQVVNLNSADVSRFNLLQVEQCYRHVFCQQRKFDPAIKFCEAIPSVRDPKRYRATVSSSFSESSEAIIATIRPQKSTEIESEAETSEA